MTTRHAWIDASAGVAGDMLLGALLDAGADQAFIQGCIDAVLPDSVRLRTERVSRAGISAIKAHVDVLVDDPPHRTWKSISTMLDRADLPEPVRQRAVATFARLAEAEGQVHGVPADDIHFHEVGALDSIADVVGVSAGLSGLGIDTLSGSRVAVGSGTVRAAHGRMPVPVPAVTRLAAGWEILAGGEGELTTPTGMAVLAALCEECQDLPAMRISEVGLGAGSKDFDGHANVTRVLIGERATGAAEQIGDPAVLLESNVDDLDPRLWPEVLAALLAAGASDAWLVPILMKKGRPAHTLCVLVHPSHVGPVRDLIMEQTSTIGVRQTDYRKFAAPRAWVRITVAGGSVLIKLAHTAGIIRQATPEFDDVVAVAAARGVPAGLVLTEAITAAQTAGLNPGTELPATASTDRRTAATGGPDTPRTDAEAGPT